MDPNTLAQANKLQKELQRCYGLANKAYNGRMYLKISLDGVDVTKEVPTKDIEETLYNHFKKKGQKAQAELDAL